MPLREKQYAGKNFVLDFDWEKVVHTYNPEIKDLPEEDRKFFEGKVKFLIGKEIRLSNIPKEKLLLYTKRIDWVIKTMRYPQLFSREYVRFEIVELLARLGLPISQDALGFKFGPMSYQFRQEQVKQELVNIPTGE